MRKNLAAAVICVLRRLGAAMLFSAMLAASTAGVHAAALQPLVSVDWLKAHQSEPLLGMTAVAGSHLASPSSGRAVSPEDFAGACAPCASKK